MDKEGEGTAHLPDKEGADSFSARIDLTMRWPVNRKEPEGQGFRKEAKSKCFGSTPHSFCGVNRQRSDETLTERSASCFSHTQYIHNMISENDF